MANELEITNVIGTPCLNTSHRELLTLLEERVGGKDQLLTVEFTNVHITAARKVEKDVRDITEQYDFFVPDSQILKWAVNLCGGSMQDRVYGPDFLNYGIYHTSKTTKHYFLGASQDCLEKLIANSKDWNSNFQIVGSHNGYFKPKDEDRIADDINACDPDFIWVGLGTPKQQEWIARNRSRITRGALLAVGFAFDVNAGTKKDAPQWMQPLGLTWLYRLCSEPRRLWWRYLKYNSIFVYYLIKQKLTGSLL